MTKIMFATVGNHKLEATSGLFLLLNKLTQNEKDF